MLLRVRKPFALWTFVWDERACTLAAVITLIMDKQQMSPYADGTKAEHMDLSAPSETSEWRSVRAPAERTHLILSSSHSLSSSDAYYLP